MSTEETTKPPRNYKIKGYRAGASKKIGGLTYQQRRYVKAYLESKGNGQIAVMKSYPNVKPEIRSSISSRNLSNPNIKNAIIKALDKAGLGDDFIADTLKKNIPSEAIGKGANAVTVNKSLEMLIKLREPARVSKSSNLHLHMLQGIESMNEKELIDRRKKNLDYFADIIKESEEKEEKKEENNATVDTETNASTS